MDKQRIKPLIKYEENSFLAEWSAEVKGVK